MATNEKPTSANDYAVAKVLNEKVNNIFAFIGMYQTLAWYDEFDEAELNRAYILLVNELEILYDRNPKLKEINPKPLWMEYDVIKSKMYAIQKYVEKHGVSKDHILRVEKLCILAGEEAPVFSTEQKKHMDYMDGISNKYVTALQDPTKKTPKEALQEKLNANPDPRDERYWCIEKYTVTYKPDGTILINDTFKLKKVHINSSLDRLIEQALDQPNTLFKPDIGKTARNLSTVLSSAGFTSTLRDIFFPIVSEEKGIMFRPIVTREEVQKDRIDTYELDTMLFERGVESVVRPKDELVELGLADPDDDEPKST
jgi:hypothetical protein